MTRFFIPTTQIKENQVFLIGEDQHHLVKVLRKKPGDRIAVLNGKGEEYDVEIKEINSEFVVGQILGTTCKSSEPKVKITLVQSLPKSDKFDWIIQKNTELGVSRFIPVISERSTIKLDQATAIKKVERWRKIIQTAAEQSGRGITPELTAVWSWKQLLAELPKTLVVIPWEGEQESSLKLILKSQPDPAPEVTVLIGPEGGFSLKEIAAAKEQGAQPVTLGPRIFRTETAGLVAATAILYHFDDLG